MEWLLLYAVGSLLSCFLTILIWHSSGAFCIEDDEGGYKRIFSMYLVLIIFTALSWIWFLGYIALMHFTGLVPIGYYPKLIKNTYLDIKEKHT